MKLRSCICGLGVALVGFAAAAPIAAAQDAPPSLDSLSSEAAPGAPQWDDGECDDRMWSANALAALSLSSSTNTTLDDADDSEDESYSPFTPDDDAPIPHMPFQHRNDSLPDFSFVGYRALSSPIPSFHKRDALVTLHPTGNTADRTRDIQLAIDIASNLGGGVVRLAAGAYYLDSNDSIRIPKSNLVLMGDGEDTIIYPRGTNRTVFFLGTGDAGTPNLLLNQTSPITDDYIPTGTRYVKVQSGKLFKTGDSIIVARDVTEGWLSALGMNNLTRDGRRQTWLRVGSNVTQARTVLGVSSDGRTLELDAPLTDGYDARAFGGNPRVVAIEQGRTAKEVGLESMKLVMNPSQSNAHLSGEFMRAIVLDGVEDSWARNIRMDGFFQSVTVGYNGRRLTLDSLSILRNRPTFFPAPGQGTRSIPADISLQGTQVLVKRCRTIGARDTRSFTVSTQSLTMGPNAVYQHLGDTSHMAHVMETHQRWATGLLVDSSRFGVLSTTNRENLGTGHGLTANNAIHWNSKARQVVCQQAPAGLGAIFLVNVRGRPNPDIKNDCHAVNLGVNGTAPTSLLYAQLSRRVGWKNAKLVL